MENAIIGYSSGKQTELGTKMDRWIRQLVTYYAAVRYPQLHTWHYTFGEGKSAERKKG